MIWVVLASVLLNILFFLALVILVRWSPRRAHRDITCLTNANSSLWAMHLELGGSVELLQAAVEGILIAELCFNYFLTTIHLNQGGLMARNIFLIAGPSGSGKTTLTQELVCRISRLAKAITVTTRQPRPGEISGIDYYFVSTERFREMQANGELVESDFIYNEYYGVPRSALDMPCDTAIVITVDGALTLRRQEPNTPSIFIMPASLEAASARVVARKCPNEEFRVRRYEAEVLAARHFDHVVLNLDFTRSLRQIEGIILARRVALACSQQ